MGQQPQHQMRSEHGAGPGRVLPVPCSCRTEVFSTLIGELLLLRVGGQVDLATLPVLQAALDAGISQRPAYLVPDLSRTSLCTSPGVEILCLSARHAHRRGIGFALSGVPSWLDRIWAQRWGAELPLCYRTPAAALTGFRTRQPALSSTAPTGSSPRVRNRHRFVPMTDVHQVTSELYTTTLDR